MFVQRLVEFKPIRGTNVQKLVQPTPSTFHEGRWDSGFEQIMESYLG